MRYNLGMATELQRVQAWKKAFDTSEAASDIVYEAFSDMPCDLYDVCPDLEELLNEASAAVKIAPDLDTEAVAVPKDASLPCDDCNTMDHAKHAPECKRFYF